MIGEKLTILRKSKKISQKQLAEIIGVRKSAVSLYETNKNDPTDPIKIKLAKYFDVSLDYLLGITDYKVKSYNENNFVKLPENVSEEEKLLIQHFVDFIVYNRNPPSVK